jgi:cyclophilin family peptidyl-prolyl cis-trans isomerase
MKARTTAGRKSNPVVYLDITIGGLLAGRMLIELRKDVVPLAAENFKYLCTGQYGKNLDDKERCYKGCKFTRNVTDYLCQTGDWLWNDGSGSEASFDGTFKDENFILRHCGPGCLSYANIGPDTNGSQFFLTFVETEWLDDRHVVFGCLMGKESFEVLDKIHEASTEEGTSKTIIVIADCGEYLAPN